jgi:membrane-associated phospholipid phosphatase
MRFRQLVLVFPLVMWTATLVTGNHYIVDGLLGMVVAMTALYIAWRIQLWGDNRQARKEQQLPEELEANLLAS